MNEPSIECVEFRDYFEGRGLAADADFTARMEQHAGQCRRCRDLKVQTMAIAMMTAELPQFDVPESLTQRILASVAAERGKGQSADYRYLAPLSLVCVAIALASMQLESVEGTMSWLIGLLGLIGLQFLLSGTGVKSRVT